MDIPLFKDLLKSKLEIDVEDSHGKTVKFFPLQAKRGTGSQINCISILGLSKQQVQPATQYYVHFKGNQLGATFERISEKKGTWEGTLQTIISAPEFWA